MRPLNDVGHREGLAGTRNAEQGLPRNAVLESLDELDWAPEGGWSLETADVVTLYEGHGYLVWTWENHFAKFRVVEIGDDYVVIDWAYQIDEGNPELIVMPGAERNAAISER